MLEERRDGSFQMPAEVPSGRRVWVIRQYDREPDEMPDVSSHRLSHQLGDAAWDTVDQRCGGSGMETAGVGCDLAASTDGDPRGDGRMQSEKGVGSYVTGAAESGVG